MSCVLNRRMRSVAAGVIAATAVALSHASAVAAGALEVVHGFAQPPQNPRGIVRASDGQLYVTTSDGGLHGKGTVLRMQVDGAVTVLHDFSGADGAAPMASLIEGQDGAFYGSTASGGGANGGAVFRIDPAGVFTVLHSFVGTDGFAPQARLVQAGDGALYGVTQTGGLRGRGTVFRISPNGDFTRLHSFSGTDGYYPQATLLFARDGALYGTTTYGGASNRGTVFKIDAAGVFTPLHSFDGTDGANPGSMLVEGDDGFLYGLAQSGGAANRGVIFRIDGTGNFHVLHSFSVAGGYPPQGDLVRSADGTFFGVTQSGGPFNRGTVFRVDTAGLVTTLYAFSGPEGFGPQATLVVGPDGALYGSTTFGGRYGGGTLFRITTSGVFASLFSFSGADGWYPQASLVVGDAGSFYGLTLRGGLADRGTVFRLAPDRALASFTIATPEPWLPATPVVEAADGALYGVTANGGDVGLGTIFRIHASGAFAVVHAFDYADGYLPHGGLVRGPDGSLYGTTQRGGPADAGTVFKIDAATGAFVPLHSFGGPDGYYPFAGLVVGADGALYGTTIYGGTGNGTVFRVEPTGAFTSLRAFSYAEGIYPQTPLVLGADGGLYGTTPYGGKGAGTVFRIDATGAFRLLHVFAADGADGTYAIAPLLSHGGAVYGTTMYGGSLDAGTVFRIDASGVFTSLHAFTYTDGAHPQGRLAAGNDGALYGTTLDGGASYGTVFRIDPAGALTSSHSFTFSDGAFPRADLALGVDGSLYGATPYGGTGNVGTVFRVDATGAFAPVQSLDSAVDGGGPMSALISASDGELYGVAPTGGPKGGGVVYRVSVPRANVITFGELPDRIFGDAPFAATATASSGLPVTFGATGACSVSGNMVALLGAGTCTVVASQPGNANYPPALPVWRSFTIARGAPLLEWPTPADIVYGTPLGAAELNARASVAGTFVYTPPAGAVLDAGAAQPLVVTFTPADAANYATTTASVKINVLPATPTVSWPTPADIVYGTPLSAAQLNARASVAGTFAYTPPTGAMLDAGPAQPLVVTFAPTDTANYVTTTASVAINVLPATPTVSWPTPADIVYGTPLGAAELNARASVAGTFVYTPPAGAVLDAGPAQPLVVTFTPADAANYATATASVAINVLPATPMVWWPTPADIVYGAPLGAAELNAGANVAGTFSYAPPAGAVLTAGAAQPLEVVFTPADANHTTATARVVLNVLRAPQAITFTPLATRAYGDPPVTLTATAGSGLPVSFAVLDGPAVLDGATLTITGPAAVTVRASQAGDVNFLPAPDVDQSFAVIQAVVTTLDRSANEGARITLDGSASSGPALTYVWTQLAGPPALLESADASTTTTVMPLLPGGFGQQTLTFQLAVSSGGASSVATVNVLDVNVNHAPIAGAGPDVSVNEGSVVVLTATHSYDPDADPITYVWEQTGGLPVTLEGADTATPRFTAPLLPGGVGGSAALQFRLTVSDGPLSASAPVNVIVEQLDHAPTADAGLPQTARPLRTLALDGRLSSDPDGDDLAYEWRQVGGPSAPLIGATTATPTFTTPAVTETTVLTFELVVSDSVLRSEPARVAVTVVNDRPACEAARAEPALLWPPRHAMVRVRIVGVTDPDDDRVRITITGVTQDEPVDGLGDGDTSPDALVEAGRVLVRAERSGRGNGRVYRIRFTAEDGEGGACSGQVTVAVPHSRKPGAPAVDDGQFYDSARGWNDDD